MIGKMIHRFIYLLVLYLPLGTMVLSSFERFIAVRKPFYHRSKITKRTLQWSISSIYMTSIILSIIPSGLIMRKNRMVTMAFDCFEILITFICIVTVLFLHSITYNAIKKSMMSRLSQTRDRLVSCRHNGSHYNAEKLLDVERRKERRVFKLFVAMAIIYIVTFLPKGLLNILHVARRAFSKHAFYRHFAIWLMTQYAIYLLSSAINPVLTLAIHDDYRHVITRWYGNRKKKSSHETCSTGSTRSGDLSRVMSRTARL